MSEHTSKHQIIRSEEGTPLYVLVPWDEYESSGFFEDEESVVPFAVARLVSIEGKSPIRAWREYLHLTQTEAAQRLEMDQSAYARLEKPGVRSRRVTLERVAQVFGIEVAQLNL